MKCKNQNCLKELPFQARYCTFCGEKTEQYKLGNSYPIHCFDILRTDIPVFPKEFIPVNIDLEQQECTARTRFPGLSGYCNILAVPDSHNNYFGLYEINHMGNRLLGHSTPIIGDFSNATTPLYDGMYFNVVSSNKIYRFGINRNSEMIAYSEEYFQERFDEKIKNPVMMIFHEKRVLAFIARRKLFIIDISKIGKEITPGINLPSLSPDEEWLTLFAPQNNESLFLLTSKAKLYKYTFSEKDSLKNGDITLCKDYEYLETGSPIIKDNRIMFVGKGNNNRNMFGKYEILNGNVTSKSIEGAAQISADIKCIPIHSEWKMFLFNNIRPQQALSIDSSGYATMINFPNSINYRKFLIDNDYLYSLLNTNISIYNLINAKKIGDIPVSTTMNNPIVPISDMFYLNGLITFLTRNRVYIIRDTFIRN